MVWMSWILGLFVCFWAWDLRVSALKMLLIYLHLLLLKCIHSLLFISGGAELNLFCQSQPSLSEVPSSREHCDVALFPLN